jgi:hypothetical protein
LKKLFKPSEKTETSHPSLKSAWSNDKQIPRYQWFWAGTQDETKKLTPDLKHTVKRHVVVKRIVSLADFPLGTIQHLVGDEIDFKRLADHPELTSTDQSKMGASVSQQSGQPLKNSAASEALKPLLVAWEGKILPVRHDYLRMALKRYFTFSFCTTVSIFPCFIFLGRHVLILKRSG